MSKAYLQFLLDCSLFTYCLLSGDFMRCKLDRNFLFSLPCFLAGRSFIYYFLVKRASHNPIPRKCSYYGFLEASNNIKNLWNCLSFFVKTYKKSNISYPLLPFSKQKKTNNDLQKFKKHDRPTTDEEEDEEWRAIVQ